MILIRQEARRQPRAKKDRHDAEQQQSGHCHPAFAYQRPAHADVTVGGAFKHSIEPVEELSQRAGVGFLGLKQQRGKSRTQTERVERRDDHGNRDGDRELLVQPPGNARYEGRGDEYRREHQSNADDGP